jgi:nucleoside-diphosphate kinase
VVLGVLDDKDAAGIVAELAPVAAHVFATAPSSDRASDPDRIADLAEALDLQVTVHADVAEATAAARGGLRQSDRRAVIVAGSVILAGEALAARDRRRLEGRVERMTEPAEPAQPAPRQRRARGAAESLASIVLGSESIVVFLGGLVVYGLKALPEPMPQWWGVVAGVLLAVLMLLTAVSSATDGGSGSAGRCRSSSHSAHSSCPRSASWHWFSERCTDMPPSRGAPSIAATRSSPRTPRTSQEWRTETDMATEETLVLVKPDGVARGLTGAILARIEAKGYSLVDLRLVEPDRERLERHYAEHEGKPFYEPLVEFMMSGPSVAIRLAGNRVIEGFRSLAGATDPTAAAPGTIRGDLGRDWGLKVQQNLVHGSDSPESAARELEIWF